MSGNQLYSYDLTGDGDTLAGKSHGKLLADAAEPPTAGPCASRRTARSGPASTARIENKESFLHVVSYKPGAAACVDHGPIAVKNPDFTNVHRRGRQAAALASWILQV